MFLVYINDLVELLASFNIKVILFAADVKLYVKIVNITDAFALHKALSVLFAWADEWQLSISIDKCCVLHIGEVSVTRQFHIKNEIVAKAHQRAHMIHR